LLTVAGAGGRRGGFTLVELLVVIAIVIILVSMLFPFLDGIRERGYVSLCQNNLEKILMLELPRYLLLYLILQRWILLAGIQ